MAGERTVRASRRRVAAAHRAGVRPDAPLLRVAAMAAAMLVGSAFVVEIANQAVTAALRPELDWAALESVTWRWTALMAVFVVAAIGVGLASRSAGPVRRDPNFFPARAVSAGPWVQGLVALAGIALCFAALRGVLAGAARGTDASLAGLTALYGGWAIRLLMAVVGITAVLGTAQLGVALWRRRQDLAQTPEQARRMAREARRR